jgi:hypothetical protein
MQVCQRRVTAIAVERVLGRPLDQDQNLSRRNVADDALPEFSKGDDLSAMRRDCLRRAA